MPTGDAIYRHERLSANFAREWLREKGIPERTVEPISQSILAHHGCWEKDFRPVGRKYAEAQQQLSQMLHHALGSPVPPEEKPQDLSAFGMCLAGHIVLSDWIASNEQFFCDSRLTHLNDPKTYFAEARNVAQEWTRKLDLARPRSQGKPSCVVKMPRPLQETLLTKDISPGLIIIEAPMGEGKTEAAWILAEKWRDQGYRGMYMALPTMATSDSLFLRYREDYLKQLFPHEEAKLVHGMAWLRDEKEPEKTPEIGESVEEGTLAATWFRPTRRAMLAAHGVGTVDQAMLAGMKVKFGFLRLYGLTGRILVIDEVHAYDAYMSAIIVHLLQWCSCLKIPVILLSATLSSRQRQDMIEAYGASGTPGGKNAPYPLITVAESGKEIQALGTEACSSRILRIELLPELLGNSKATAKKAEELVQKGGCCCVILNTVKQAQKIYEELQLPEHQKILFHARFTAKDRQEITEKVLRLFGKDRTNRPEKFVLIATQVVEQSLDVDFDHMISEIAPIDLLLQRSGREHRHQKRSYTPILHILLPQLNSCEKEPDFGNTSYVYAKKTLLRTLALLENHPEIHLPEDFRPLIEHCYG
ncbi:MAG TPA: CRISPR-associated helicase Cas3', partial [Synergistaceae bacterium]|nr:CRISPR-associated helicase Cas3' [Synergistaceae bacterium]